MTPERGKPFSLFEPATNPSSRWLIVGEAPGEEEDRASRPFIGASGKLLNRLLQQAGFEIEVSDRTELRTKSCFHFTNVFTSRPPDNDLKKNWTLTKTELRKLGYSESGRLPPLNKRYIHPEQEAEVARLHEEIKQLSPEFILPLGGTALWALTGEARITVNRGTLLPLHLGSAKALASPTTTPSSASNPLIQTSSLPTWASRLSPLWALPSFHPAMVLRQWDNRPLLWADLVKARRFLSHQLSPPLRRRLLVDPTMEELEQAYRTFSSRAVSRLDPLGVDIETDPRIGQITTVSFGFRDVAICIPFYNKATLPTLCNYWRTAREEAQAWRMVMRFADLPHFKVLQNGLYDTQYFLEDFDIRLRQYEDDTAILQHCLQPELPKALGTLASLYINEPAWKLMRTSIKDENKADD